MTYLAFVERGRSNGALWHGTVKGGGGGGDVAGTVRAVGTKFSVVESRS